MSPRLLGNGFEDHGGGMLMVLDRTRDPGNDGWTAADGDPSVTIERLHRISGDAAERAAEAIAGVLVASFAVEPERRVAIELEAVLGLANEPYHAVLIRVDGEPAAVARRTTFAGATYLSSIGTAPAFRGRGLGRLVTSVAVEDGARQPGAAGSISACSRRTTSPNACTGRSGSCRSAASRRTCCSGRDGNRTEDAGDGLTSVATIVGTVDMERALADLGHPAAAAGDAVRDPHLGAAVVVVEERSEGRPRRRRARRRKDGSTATLARRGEGPLGRYAGLLGAGVADTLEAYRRRAAADGVALSPGRGRPVRAVGAVARGGRRPARTSSWSSRRSVPSAR